MSDSVVCPEGSEAVCLTKEALARLAAHRLAGETSLSQTILRVLPESRPVEPGGPDEPLGPITEGD